MTDEEQCRECGKHKVRCWAEAMKYDPENCCKCWEKPQTDKEQELKKQIALKYGFKLKMPTEWDYAMKVVNRTNKQLEMYEDLIKEIIQHQKAKEKKFVKRLQKHIKINWDFFQRQEMRDHRLKEILDDINELAKEVLGK